MLNASINLVNGPSHSMPGQKPGPSAKPGKPSEAPDNPAEKAKARQRERLQKQQEQISKRLERLGKTAVADILRTYAEVITAADDPQGLFAVIRPVLTKMNLGTSTEASKTELIPGRTNSKGHSLFKVILRRTAELDDDIINRIKRQDDSKDSFESMRWTSAGLEMFIWAPYTPPAEVGLPAGI
jgi:hypothetical protein